MAQLAALAARAAAGEPAVVVVVGEGGIGKSSLLRQFRAAADAGRELDAGGDEAEVDLDYAVADGLLGDAGWSRNGHGGTTMTAAAVGARLLAAMTDEPDRLTLVTVDDAHWADQPSLRALTFAARRLRPGDRCLLVVATRPEGVARLPESLRKLADDGGTRIVVEGLTAPELDALASARGRRLSHDAVDRLYQATMGSPLHASALLDELADTDLSRPGPLPPPAAFHTLVMGKVAACSPPAEALLAAAAVLGDRGQLAHLVALAGTDLDDPVAALDDVVAAGLLVVPPDEGTVQFAHPLVRAAVYHELTPGRRATLHRRAATITDSGLTSMRHALAGVVGIDDSVADRAAAWADDTAAEGGHAAAAAIKLGAARVTGDPATRQRRHLEAIVEMVAASQYDAAFAAFHEVADIAATPLSASVRGLLAFLAGQQAESLRYHADAWRMANDSAHGSAPSEAGMAARNLGAGFAARLRYRDALDVLLPALDVASDTPNLRNDALVTLAVAGRVVDALDLAAGHPDWFAPGVPAGASALRGRGVARYLAGDVAQAIADLSDAEVISRQHGPGHRWHEDLAYLATAEIAGTDWDSALAHLAVATSLADEPGSSVVGSCVHCTMATLLYSRGRTDEADRLVERAAAMEANNPGTVAGPVLAATRAHRAWIAGDPQAALSALEACPAFDLDGPDGTWLARWQGPMAWALAGVGRLADAEAVADRLRAAAQHAGPVAEHQAWVTAGRVAAKRGDLAGAAGHYRSALEHPAPGALDRAVAELELGEVLVRAGRSTDAAGWLQRATADFRAVDAQPFLDRVAVALAASGVDARPEPAPTFPGGPLTPAEESVARLVRAGASNRDVAEALVLSVRTVESHLARIYRKLGVRSRTQLLARLGALSADVS